MNRRGNCYDNVPMERFFRSYKSEWIPYKAILTLRRCSVTVADTYAIIIIIAFMVTIVTSAQ